MITIFLFELINKFRNIFFCCICYCRLICKFGITLFAVKSDDYTFNIEDVKCRRKVIAPYKADGKPKDWEETSDGKFRNTYPSNFWDDISIPYWSMPENTEHPTQKPEKLIERLKTKPKDFTYDEAKNILNNLGFYENNKGKTSGSRVEFQNGLGIKIVLHKPHPSNIIKPYKIKDIISILEEGGLI